MASEKTPTLVFIPFPVMSHQTAAIQMANLLVARDNRLSATIVVMKMPFDTKFTSHPKDNNNTRISIVQLPQDDSNFIQWGRSPQTFVTHFVPSQKAPVRDAVAKIATGGSARIVGFVVDMFCTSMMDVADDLGVPSYVFFTCGAAALGLMFHLQGLKDDDQGRDLAVEYGSNSDAAVSFPTYANPVPTKVWPSFVFEEASGFPDFVRKFRGAKGIVVNTFFELEAHAIRALSCDGKIPPVYPVGPIIHEAPRVETGGGIIKWLDTQPDSSVVFICFGSNGSFEKDQVDEIAFALESCGHGFLWSLRKPPPKEILEFPGEYENPGDILPDGFLERTIGFGKVIGWAPQLAVLSHPAVGGFVSHCGWNSTLESVWCDVPVAAWPVAAEQQANAFQLVKELGMAVEIKMDYRKGCDEIVPAGVIDKAIKELMGSGNIEGRAKVRALSEKSRVVMMEGGSSYDYLGRFISDVLD